MIRKRIPAALAVTALVLFGLVQPASAEHPLLGFFSGGCCDNKVCRPTVETRTIAKRVYDDVCEDFCLPKCSLCGHFLSHSGCCEDCGSCGTCAYCEHPRTKKFLLVKIRHEDECVNKCVLEKEVCPPPAQLMQPPPPMPPRTIKGVGQIGFQPMPMTINK